MSTGLTDCILCLDNTCIRMGKVNSGISKWNVKDIMNYVIIRMFYNLDINHNLTSLI